jgi:hypothetical protein
MLVETDKVEVTIKVDRYSWSKKWFYGSIKIRNKTDSAIYFNFNQALRIKTIDVYPEWNIFPISYYPQAFEVIPGATRTWIVVWSVDMKNMDFGEVQIVPDDKIKYKNKFQIKLPIFSIDTSLYFKEPALLKY